MAIGGSGSREVWCAEGFVRSWPRSPRRPRFSRCPRLVPAAPYVSERRRRRPARSRRRCRRDRVRAAARSASALAAGAARSGVPSRQTAVAQRDLDALARVARVVVSPAHSGVGADGRGALRRGARRPLAACDAGPTGPTGPSRDLRCRPRRSPHAPPPTRRSCRAPRCCRLARRPFHPFRLRLRTHSRRPNSCSKTGV